MLKYTLNSAPRLILTKNLNFEDDDLTVVTFDPKFPDHDCQVLLACIQGPRQKKFISLSFERLYLMEGLNLMIAKFAKNYGFQRRNHADLTDFDENQRIL